MVCKKDVSLSNPTCHLSIVHETTVSNTTTHTWSQGMFDADSTQSACEEYLKRKTGSEKHDSCPDFTFVPAPSEDKIPYCESKNWHLGGNEFLAYCKQFGGDEAQDLDLSLSRKRFHA
ncbi:hypothetical protein HYALB_00002036 [Hymenoscyphus albidus]|uniref:Uncharacterized protein n=1 Tax=Hymenoscyphus albidus TaxID=595503 RepID=A0A9N9LC84_9HELO|nr:hypothetical protein HYALB_00002036 [Hymenoscyphus albidus]